MIVYALLSLTEHVLQHPVAHHLGAVDRDRGPHHRNVEMSGGVAPGEFVRAGREQEIAGDRADLGAVGVALVVHGQRLVARLRFMPKPTCDTA